MERNSFVKFITEYSQASIFVFMNEKLSQWSFSLGCGWSFAFRCYDNGCRSACNGKVIGTKCTIWQQCWIAVMLCLCKGVILQIIAFVYDFYGKVKPHSNENYANQVSSVSKIRVTYKHLSWWCFKEVNWRQEYL